MFSVRIFYVTRSNFLITKVYNLCCSKTYLLINVGVTVLRYSLGEQ